MCDPCLTMGNHPAPESASPDPSGRLCNPTAAACAPCSARPERGGCKHSFLLAELAGLIAQGAMPAWITPHCSAVICTQWQNWAAFGFAALGSSASSASLTSGNGQTR